MKFLKPLLAVGISTMALCPPAPAAEFELVGREMVRLLQSHHYSRLPFNAELSEKFFERYLDALDPEKAYFLSGEIADLKRQHGRTLHDRLSVKSAMPVAEGIFEIYRARVRIREKYVQDLLAKGKFNFKSEKMIERDRTKATWPDDGPALYGIWREQVESALLDEFVRRERLTNLATEQGKPDPFKDAKSAKEMISLRYQRLLKTVEGNDKEDIANFFLSAVANAYDPHSEYLSAAELEQFKIDVSNELVGIGARLRMNDSGETEVLGIVNGGPSDHADGLKLGDRITAISPEDNGQWEDILFHPIDKVIESVLGQEGNPIGLRVRRDSAGEEKVVDVTIKRGLVTMKDDLAKAQILEFNDEGELPLRIAILTIPSFYFDFEDTGHRVSVDVERILERLLLEEIDALALDLRDNGGGSVPEVQRLTGFFTGNGPVVQIKSINAEIDALKSLHTAPLYDGPLLIMTDKGSASATEILAGALQDYNRAIVVGASSTYGKGTVQQPIDIADYMPVYSDRERAGWLKLTFQKYYRPSGSSVQLRGVVPDIILPDLSDAYEAGEAAKPYALPHDIIRRSADFTPRNRDDLSLPVLLEKSAARVAGSPDFAYLREDLDRIRTTLRENTISLNRETRLSELRKDENRRTSRSAERRGRFAAMAADDKRNFTIYRLTLDDLDKAKLPIFDPEDTSSGYMREIVDPLADLEETDLWPSGLDPMERESLNILTDLITTLRVEPVADIPSPGDGPN